MSINNRCPPRGKVNYLMRIDRRVTMSMLAVMVRDALEYWGKLCRIVSLPDGLCAVTSKEAQRTTKRTAYGLHVLVSWSPRFNRADRSQWRELVPPLRTRDNTVQRVMKACAVKSSQQIQTNWAVPSGRITHRHRIPRARKSISNVYCQTLHCLRNSNKSKQPELLTEEGFCSTVTLMSHKI